MWGMIVVVVSYLSEYALKWFFIIEISILTPSKFYEVCLIIHGRVIFGMGVQGIRFL